MAERLAFDTNALIYHFQGVSPYALWLEPILISIGSGEREAVVSVIAEAELLVKPLRDGDEVMLESISSFLGHPSVHVIAADRAIAGEAGRLRAQLNLALADAVIVATAVVEGCDALVGNDARCAERVTQVPYIYLDDAVKAT